MSYISIMSSRVGDILENDGKKYLVVEYEDYGDESETIRGFALINEDGKREYRSNSELVFSKVVGRASADLMKGVRLEDKLNYEIERYNATDRGGSYIGKIQPEYDRWLTLHGIKTPEECFSALVAEGRNE